MGSAVWELSRHAGTPNLAPVAWKRSGPSVVCFLNRPVMLPVVRLWAYSPDWLCCLSWSCLVQQHTFKRLTSHQQCHSIDNMNRPVCQQQAQTRKGSDMQGGRKPVTVWRRKLPNLSDSPAYTLSACQWRCAMEVCTHPHQNWTYIRTNTTRQYVVYYCQHFLWLSHNIFGVYYRRHWPASDGP